MSLRSGGQGAIIAGVSRRIVIIAFDRVQSLDVSGPAEVFALAADDRLRAAGSYRIELVAADGRPVVTSSGLRLMPHQALDACRGEIDTLIVAGGRGVHAAADDERLVSWLRLAARRSRRVCSVCTGAFLLARAGLLDGRRATTHWRACAALARAYPSVDVDPAPIFVRDGNVYTSAGVTAGIDLALALVEEDLHEDLSVSALAERVFMSARNFARVFAAEVGVTPGAFVESLRIERARTLLETTDLQLQEISRRCGFGTVETMRRTLARRLGVSPSELRREPAAVIPLTRRVAS